MHVIKCKGRRVTVLNVFSAFSSTGKCGSFSRLRLIWPCNIIVQKVAITQVTTNHYSPHSHDGEE